MSEATKVLIEQSIGELRQTVDGVRRHYAKSGHPNQDLAATYVTLLASAGTSWRQAPVTPHVADTLARASRGATDLLRQQDFHGVLRETFKVLSELSGDPTWQAGTIPPPPGSKD